jgi:hypothetical protein
MKEPIFVGIDIAARELVVATRRGEWVFDNTVE